MMDIFNRLAPAPKSQNPAPQGASQGQLAPISGMPAKPPNMDLETYIAICGPGMQGPAGGNGRVGYRTANGDTGLQGANMPQPQRPSWLNELAGGLAPTQGGGGMFGVTRPTPQQGGPMQMPSAPFQSGMRAGSVGNQMGGLNNMYSNFAAPSPMPAPPPPMFGAPAGNSMAMMGPKPVGLF